MSNFPKCPKCETRALYLSTEQIGREMVICAACGHKPRQSPSLTLDAVEALDASTFTEEAFRDYWAAKIRREREKVARLMEGRW